MKVFFVLFISKFSCSIAQYNVYDNLYEDFQVYYQYTLFKRRIQMLLLNHSKMLFGSKVLILISFKFNAAFIQTKIEQ